MRGPVLPLVVSLATGGCYYGLSEDARLSGGDQTGDFGTDGGEDTEGGDPKQDEPPSLDDGVAPGRVWRLSHAQYNNTVRDLLGVDTSPADGFEAEASGSGFAAGADVSYVSPLLFEQYMHAAEALADAVDIEALAGCDVAERACVETFIADFGKRAFRKPVPAQMQDRYLDLYAGQEPVVGARLVLEAMLQSPHFLYRFELGEPGAPGEVVRLTPHELATQLSYLLWNTMPDAALLSAADKGGLSTRSEVWTEAERMLEDPRADHVLWSFVEQTFRLSNLENAQQLDPPLAAALRTEAADFLTHVLEHGDGTLVELLTANYSVIGEELAELYGVEADAAPRKVEFEPGQRSGLLTHAGFLAAHSDAEASNPVRRGLFVRTRLLCQDVPDPPPDVDDVVEPPDGIKTTRQRFEAHVYNASCAACHQLIDKIGFAFENYDEVGAFRDTENGEPVDATGELIATDSDTEFDGAVELATVLASSTEVTDCVSTQFFRYAFGRREDDADDAVLGRIHERFADADTSMEELLRASIESDVFHFRVKL